MICTITYVGPYPLDGEPLPEKLKRIDKEIIKYVRAKEANNKFQTYEIELKNTSLN